MSVNSSKDRSALAIVPKLSVVLNGGSAVLESARVPVQFGVNAALAEIQPTHVLVIIQHESEKGSFAEGIRKLIPLSRGSDFVCFESAGKHWVTFVALKLIKQEGGEEWINRYFKELRPGHYKDAIFIDPEGIPGVRFEASYETLCVAAVASKILILPKDLFAKKSSSGVWKWANLWYRYEPTDQCDYRKRLIFAFTLKPVLWSGGMVLKYLLVVLISFFLVAAKLIILILGWNPSSKGLVNSGHGIIVWIRLITKLIGAQNMECGMMRKEQRTRLLGRPLFWPYPSVICWVTSLHSCFMSYPSLCLVPGLSWEGGLSCY